MGATRARGGDAGGRPKEKAEKSGESGQATFTDETEATSGSVSHMTRLRP